MASKYTPSWEMQMRLHKPLCTATAVFKFKPAALKEVVLEIRISSGETVWRCSRSRTTRRWWLKERSRPPVRNREPRPRGACLLIFGEFFLKLLFELLRVMTAAIFDVA